MNNVAIALKRLSIIYRTAPNFHSIKLSDFTVIVNFHNNKFHNSI